MSLLFIDTSCDLSDEQIAKMGVECIRVPFKYDDKKVHYEKNYDYARLNSKCRKGIEITPYYMTTKDYIKYLEEPLKNGDDILYLHSSACMLTTDSLVEAQKQLLEMYPNRRIVLVDSCNFSVGTGVLAYLIALKFIASATIDEIDEYLFEIKNQYQLFMLLDSVDTIVANQIISEEKGHGFTLSIKPIITLDVDGKCVINDKVNGRKKGILKLVEYIRMYGENVVDYPINIVYSGNIQEAKDLQEKLITYFGKEANIYLQQMTPSNMALVGSGALGLCFHLRKKM